MMFAENNVLNQYQNHQKQTNQCKRVETKVEKKNNRSRMHYFPHRTQSVYAKVSIWE